MSLQKLDRPSRVGKVKAAPAIELTRSSEGTLHGQLYRTLVNMIKGGEVKPGDRLPTEAELMSMYAVSRTTARRALDELRRAELVERRPGRGTFVALPKLQAAIPHLHSVTAEIELLGYLPGSRLISVKEGTADEALATLLRVAVHDPVLFVKRLRTADGRPFYFAESALNVTAFPELRETDFSSPSLSLYRLFEQVTGRSVSRVVQWLSAVGATREVANNLKLRPQAPVLQLERVLFLDADVPVEMVRAFFLGKTYKYYTELGAPTPSSM